MQTTSRQIEITTQQNETVVIVLEGSLDSVDTNFRATLEVVLKNYAGATIQITDIEKGSIRIKIQGSQEDVMRLIKLVESGELTELNELPVEAIETSSRKLLEDIKIVDSVSKWELIQEIANYPLAARKLVRTDLLGANLREADLRLANLRLAILFDTNLYDAIVEQADFSGSRGLSEADKLDLIRRGAIFDDALGDRESSPSPIRR